MNWAFQILCFLRIAYWIRNYKILSGLTLTVNGCFTFDACIGAVVALIVAPIFMGMLLSNVMGEELKEIFNFYNQISKALAFRCYGKSNLLQVHSNELTVVIFVTAVGLCSLIIPAVAVMDVILFRSSPVFLLHGLAEVSETTGAMTFDLKSPALWILGITDWFFIVAIYYTILVMASLGFEAILQTTLALRTLR